MLTSLRVRLTDARVSTSPAFRKFDTIGFQKSIAKKDWVMFAFGNSEEISLTG